jgi:hypothetical protein
MFNRKKIDEKMIDLLFLDQLKERNMNEHERQ